MQAFLTAYPWDLEGDDGLNLLDRLQGEVGVDGLAFWVALPARSVLRARAVEPRIARTSGGLFAHPTPRFYEATRCKPILAEEAKGKDPLRRIVDACASRGLKMRALVSARATGRLAGKYPDMATKNAHGISSRVSLCPANPDVSAYLLGLARDLFESYRIDDLVLTDSCPDRPDEAVAAMSVPAGANAAARDLLAVCFCESCRQKALAADIDAGRAAQVVIERIDAAIAGATAEGSWAPAKPAEDAPLAAYRRFHRIEWRSLVASLVEATGGRLIVERGPSVVDEAESEPPLAARLMIDAEEWRNGPGAPSLEAGRIELKATPSLVVREGGALLVSLLAEAARSGIDCVQVDDTSLLPVEAHAHIKRALRYARRTILQ